jgi:hypothetical protein
LVVGLTDFPQRATDKDEIVVEPMDKRLSQLPLNVGGKVCFFYVEVTFQLKPVFASLGMEKNVHTPVIKGVRLFNMAVSEIVPMLVEILGESAD